MQIGRGEITMHLKPSTRYHKTLLAPILSAIILIFSLLGTPVVNAQQGIPPQRKLQTVTILPQAAQEQGRYYRVRTLALSNGALVTEHTINGPSAPPSGFDADRQAVELPEPNGITVNAIPGIMAHSIDPDGGPLYSLGCSPTAANDILKTDERAEFSDLYPGDMPPDGSWGTFTDHNNESFTIHPLIATRGTLEALWDSYQSQAPDPNPAGIDLSVDQAGPLMRSSVFDLGDYDHDGKPDHNYDGDTNFFSNAVPGQNIIASLSADPVFSPRPFTSDQAAIENLPDGTYGIELFYKARGYAVSEAYNQPTDNVVAGGFSFNQFKAEIDRGRPVMIHLGGEASTPGHSVVGVAYDAASKLIYIHDGWDTNTHTMPWGGSYADMPMFMVSVIHPVPPAHPGDFTISGYVGVPNATITYPGGSAKADHKGYYSISVPPGWSGRLIPSKPGYTFQPPFKDYSNVPDFQTKQSYTATLIQGSNLLNDPSFELSLSYPYWIGTSTTFDTPLCDASCGAGARTGSVWGWFGGIADNETATLSQTVAIPRGLAASLDFYLMIGDADAGSSTDDAFTVEVDHKTVFSADATEINWYGAYIPVSVDLSAYADGANHLITFKSVTSGQVVSFHLDDVSLAVMPYSQTLSVIKTGSGSGTVTSNPVGINCGLDCSETYPYNTNVVLNAVPAVGSTFAGWSGACSGNNSCSVRMTAAKSVTASFTAATTNVDVFVGTVKQGSYNIPDHETRLLSYFGVNQGPLKIENTEGGDLVTSQRVIYGGTSYSEMMGLPEDQLSTEYLFPYYNNVAMDSQLRVSNVGGAGTTITVYLGTEQIDQYTLAAGSATRKNYTGKNSGPLRVTSSASNILATTRVLYNKNSYSELMGLPTGQLGQEYLFPYYNNVAMNSQLRVSNVGGAGTTITVYLGTTQIDSYTLAAGGATRKNYTGRNSGPLRVTSSTSDILTTIRVLYGGSSYSELMGFPTDQLGQGYWYPVYDNANLDSQLRVSNVGSATTHITVYAGTEQIDSYDLAKGAATRKNYTGKNIGPLHVVSSTQPILTTIRFLYAGTSYYEMTGLPDSQLSNQDFFPWYNNTAMNSELRIARP
jgi:hypothetical protein